MKKITCVKCCNYVKPSKDDCDFCQACFDMIDDMIHNPMKHVRAAAAILNSTAFGANREEAKMYAFLSIFYPKMSHVDKKRLCR